MPLRSSFVYEEENDEFVTQSKNGTDENHPTEVTGYVFISLSIEIEFRMSQSRTFDDLGSISPN